MVELGVCGFMQGGCTDILKLRESTAVGSTDKELAEQSKHLCTNGAALNSGTLTCLLRNKYKAQHTPQTIVKDRFGYTNVGAMSEAIRAGRSSMDCTYGDFHVQNSAHEDHFGPEVTN